MILLRGHDRCVHKGHHACLPAPRPDGRRSTLTTLGQLIQVIRLEMQPEQGMNFMRHVYSTDRWFTFPKFQETGEYLKASMQGIGLENVEMLGAPADGSSQFGFWTMPLAWDVKSARLTHRLSRAVCQSNRRSCLGRSKSAIFRSSVAALVPRTPRQRTPGDDGDCASGLVKLRFAH